MSDTEEDVEGEEGEKKEEPLALKPPSKVQIKLVEQGRYVAGKFDILFATILKIEADIVAVHATIKSSNEALMKEFNEKLRFLTNQVLVIEKECAEEKAAAEAKKKIALGLPLEEIDAFEKFNKIHKNLAQIVRSNPAMIDQVVLKLEETISTLGPPSGKSPPSEEEAPFEG